MPRKYASRRNTINQFRIQWKVMNRTSGIRMTDRPQQVGAPDPELETSAILDDVADDGEEVEPKGTGAVCYFNGVSYPIGQYVLSGHEVLHCEQPGVWVPQGELER
jgi:hypothetical protein